MTIRNPALEKLDSLYRMTTGQDLPPLPPGTGESIISSVDTARDLGKTPVPENTIEEPGANIQPQHPPENADEEDKPDAEVSPQVEPVSEGMRQWMNVCETPRIIGDQGSTNQRPRAGQQTPTRPPVDTQRRQRTPPRPQQPRRPPSVGRLSIAPGTSQRTRQVIDGTMRAVQSKLATEGLGQLLKAARVDFCYIATRHPQTGGNTTGLFWFTDHIQIDLRYPPYNYVLFHELGHRFHIRKREHPDREGEIDRQIRGWYNLGMGNSTYMPTNYARTNHMEFWAECFAHYMSGTLRNARLRTWVKATIVAFRIVTRR